MGKSFKRSNKPIPKEEMIITKINEHLQQQLSWVGSFIGSVIGLFQILAIIRPGSCYSIVVYILILFWMMLSFCKIIRTMELLARDHINHSKFKNPEEEYQIEWSFIQKLFIKNLFDCSKKQDGNLPEKIDCSKKQADNKPKKRIWLIWFFEGVIFIVGLFLLCEHYYLAV